jgi:hypothetical protein
LTLRFRANPPDPGLCAACRHHRWIESARGSRFLLCERSRSDQRFPRYPPLPVVRCAGYEPPHGESADMETPER